MRKNDLNVMCVFSLHDFVVCKFLVYFLALALLKISVDDTSRVRDVDCNAGCLQQHLVFTPQKEGRHRNED